MRRNTYLQKNQKNSKFQSFHEKKNSFDFKIRSAEQSNQKNSMQPNLLLKKAYLDHQDKLNRMSPLGSRPNTGRNSQFEQNWSDITKNKNLKNNFVQKAFDDVGNKKKQLKSNSQLKQSNYQNKKNDKMDLFSSSHRKQQINYKGRIYRGNSFKQTEHNKHMSNSYNRKFTPTPNSRYLQKQKIKTPKPAFSKIQENIVDKQKSPENHSKKKLYDILEKNYKPKLNITKEKKVQKFDDQPFFQYVLRFSYRSKKGFIPNNPGKCNQDAYIISPNINKKSWQHYFGICDGHGIYGHHVSSFIKNNLPLLLSNSKNLQKNPKQSLHKAFETTVKKLVNDSNIDLAFSGSTVVGCYLLHDKLFCCNVGDSRSIIGSKYQKQNKWVSKSLSIDHKPSLQIQAERILKNKGRVQSFKDQQGNSLGPLRVWLLQQNIPGLAMTRSFGDLVAASVGVSWQPEIMQFTLTQNDKIILIASDGVWQFLQNDEIINYLGPYYEKNKIEEACDFLLELAHNKWTKQCSVIDDISFILIFMEYNDTQ